MRFDSTAISNGKGRLALVSSSVSTYNYSSYDAMGHALTASQTINGQSGSQTYLMGDSYDIAGHVTSVTYPSNHSVNYNYDNAGRLADRDSTHLAFTGNLGDLGAGPQRSYSTGILHDAASRMTQEQFGTTTAVFNKLSYNSRGQLTEILAATTGNDTSWNRGKIVNDYSGADNNGNLRKQTVYIPNKDQNTSSTSWYQQYEYDSLNRLTQVHEHASNTNLLWQQQFVYDRYGNRTIDYNITSSGVPRPQFTVNTVNNRLGVPSGQSGTMTYDSAGNLTTDTYSALAVARLYDAENRMTSETQANYAAGYSYDGNGHRVKRNLGGVETWQVYGLGGELLAEYAANSSYTNPQKEYGYRNGQLLITATVTAGWGTAPTLHDNPLVVNETTVQARHITELRDAINALRVHMGMTAYQWQYSATTEDWITANPILEMRIALDQAMGSPPAPGYAEGLAQGLPIKAIHIQELRDRVLAQWNTGPGTVDIRWLVTDQLGTPRMIFDRTGALANVSRHDYLPFGEEVPSNFRAGISGYGTGDGTRQKFTQNERDNETGLDFFEARYYSSTQGRFTSVDPLISSASLTEPQSWNRYSYCLGNPLRFVDPSGLEPDYFWITNGQGYYQALTREQFDAFLQDKERVQNWYPVPSGTIIPKENNQAFWGDVTPEFREENSRFLGYDVKINEQGHLEYANSMLYDGFPQEMSRYVEAHTKVMTIEITIMAFFTGPVGEVGGLTSLGLEGGGQVVARGSTAATSLIQENQLVGNAFRDEIGNLVRSAGREVETEVTKRTPFGVRRIDIEVSTQGKTLGGIETKVGSSRYLPSQRAKDAWLRFFQNLSGKCGSETLGQV